MAPGDRRFSNPTLAANPTVVLTLLDVTLLLFHACTGWVGGWVW